MLNKSLPALAFVMVLAISIGSVEFVRPSYTLNLTVYKVYGSNIILKATLLKIEGRSPHFDKGKPTVEALIKFYKCDRSGKPDGTWTATDITGSDGDAMAMYSATANGVYYFIAMYTVKEGRGSTYSLPTLSH